MSDNSKRDEFVSLFGEGNAAAIETAATEHHGDDNRGSDSFRWAILIAIGFECISIPEYAAYHGITCEWADVDAWLRKTEQRAWLGAHDGDYDYLAALGGFYTPYLPESDAKETDHA